MILGVALVAGCSYSPADTSATGRASGGPLADDYRDAVGAPAVLGATYSWGHAFVINNGPPGTVVMLDDVSLVDPTKGLRVLGVYAISVGSDCQPIPGMIRGYWHPDCGRSVQGLAVLPGEKHGYGLVYGFVADAPGIYFVKGVRVDYHVGNARYSTILDVSARLCAPFAHYARCPAKFSDGSS